MSVNHMVNLFHTANYINPQGPFFSCTHTVPNRTICLVSLQLNALLRPRHSAILNKLTMYVINAQTLSPADTWIAYRSTIHPNLRDVDINTPVQNKPTVIQNQLHIMIH